MGIDLGDFRDGIADTGCTERIVSGHLLALMLRSSLIDIDCGRAYAWFSGKTGRFECVLGWNALNDLLRNHRFAAPRLRLSRDNELVPEHTYTTEVETPRGAFRQLDIAALHRHLRSQATLVLDAVDHAHPAVRQLKHELERSFGSDVSANLSASSGTTNGFDVHWDDHDVFALQLAGRKQWRSFEPAQPDALDPCRSPTLTNVKLTALGARVDAAQQPGELAS